MIDPGEHELVTIEQPYDKVEEGLLRRIEDLRQEYMQRIQPLVDEFVARRATKVPKYILVRKG
ncbi:hypothetical protein KEU06_09205 [Pseudaminobacter sp. 19-2017]|uniref:Uncharacterized protein n=1 Tax=Pseudaminobacter soli (ex Zhang et al. 2022) TaxID=2831468 RepID=A0A942DWX6_9HYPH|nr:hypothetical protein [Pseudaminobacter soli]MBS3648781.1 hypothetical protein [Pseudaminobacter soli]